LENDHGDSAIKYATSSGFFVVSTWLRRMSQTRVLNRGCGRRDNGWWCELRTVVVVVVVVVVFVDRQRGLEY
jgi:hypothetical protein